MNLLQAACVRLVLMFFLCRGVSTEAKSVTLDKHLQQLLPEQQTLVTVNISHQPGLPGVPGVIVTFPSVSVMWDVNELVSICLSWYLSIGHKSRHWTTGRLRGDLYLHHSPVLRYSAFLLALHNCETSPVLPPPSLPSNPTLQYNFGFIQFYKYPYMSSQLSTMYQGTWKSIIWKYWSDIQWNSSAKTTLFESLLDLFLQQTSAS